MKPQPFELPDLRKLSPEERKVAMKKYKASQSDGFNHNVKADVAARKAGANARITLRVALVNAGGINGDDEIDELIAMLHSRWANAGVEASAEDALQRLASDPVALNETIGHYREAFPANFVDITHAERMPASKQFQAKVQLINRHTDNIAGGERAQAPLIAKAQARGAVQPKHSRVSMPLPPT
jgi:hypothetical protein